MGRGAWGSKGLQELDTTQRLNHHKFHGQRSLGSYRPLSRKELDMTEHTPEWHECLWPAWYRMRVSLIGRANSKGVASLELCFSDIYVTKMLFAVLCLGPNQSDPPFSFPTGYSSLKAVRPHPGRPFFHTQPRSTPGLLPRPPAAQPVHGRTDWIAKYASRRWLSQNLL